MRVFLLGVFCALSVQARDYYCYFPGAGGLKSYIEDDVQKRLQSEGVPFETFDFVKRNNVEERSREAVSQLEALIKRDPQARCHIVSYSMGGVVARYLSNHSQYNLNGELRPVAERIVSIASIATPHRGTPFAGLLKRSYPGVHPGVDDLTETEMLRYNVEGSQDYSPEIEGIPFYSYETYVENRSEIVGGLGRVGYQYMLHVLTQRGDDPTNDGFVPTSSMAFGELVDSYRVPHEFMWRDVDGEVDAYGVFKAHWQLLMQRRQDENARRSFLPLHEEFSSLF